MTEVAYAPPPPGMLSEQIDLPEHGMALGLLHLAGAGLRVCVWDGGQMRHMSPARASRWSAELAEGPFGASFAPVSAALETLSNRAVAIELVARVRRNAPLLSEMQVEGNA